MARRRRSHKIRFPLTVRQAQKLASNRSISIASLIDAIGLDPDSDRARLQAELARMAAKASPSQLISAKSDELEESYEVVPQSSSPWDEDEGDDNSNAQPHSSEENEQRGSGDPSDLAGEGSDRGASNSGDRSETGEILTLEDGKSENEVLTSEGQGEDGKSQSSDRQLGESPSTAMGDSDHPDGTSCFGERQPRDADVQEPANSQDQESDPVPQPQEGGNQGSDDRPAHQKKWGKKFSKAEVSGKGEVSARADNSHGGVTASLQKFGINTKLVKLCRQRLSLLVGDSTSEYSHRRDYAEFCIRLKTYRNPSSARKEEEGRPAILIMADVSDSCSSFSRQSVAVAKAASQLGVPGADVLVLTHSNGNPEELEHNGKLIDTPKVESWNKNKKVDFYKGLIQRFNISVVVALGDWDAVDCYLLIASQPIVERLIWLDRGCSSQVRDRTKSALARIISYDISQIRHKLTYRDGCRDTVTFVDNIK